jgi:hypothetical protein
MPARRGLAGDRGRHGGATTTGASVVFSSDTGAAGDLITSTAPHKTSVAR